jgi:hypothetical protein
MSGEGARPARTAPAPITDKRRVRPATAENLLSHALVTGDVGTARLIAWLLA